MPTMVDPMDDIANQAHQGSVAAIIQVLNEKLADSGVRTRAIFVEGVLQLLCEASHLDQLEQPQLVERIRHILEGLEPRHIRRVNINSRIAREQQLLWLEEISREPDDQLLWCQEITLARPNLFKRLTRKGGLSKSKYSRASSRSSMPKTPPPHVEREKRQFWRGIVGGASLSLLLLLVGWVLYEWLGNGLMQPQSVETTPLPEPAASGPDPAPPDPAVPTPTPETAIAPQPDAFVQAVRLAEQAANDGQSAQLPAEWLDIATRWQRASDLMAEVPADDSRYRTAQDRVEVYRQNSEAALRRAEQQRP